jgi:hypothetical protein
MALTAVMLVAFMAAAVGRADAATFQLALLVDGSKDIDINIAPVEPGEFKALDSSWGRLTLDGALVATYVHTREDKIHSGSMAPTDFPNPFYRIAIRAIGAPTEVLILEGAARPLAEGGGAKGGVTVATGALAFLRGATFTLAGGVLTLTF